MSKEDIQILNDLATTADTTRYLMRKDEEEKRCKWKNRIFTFIGFVLGITVTKLFNTYWDNLIDLIENMFKK